jgi:hypothetical protein
MLYDIQVEIEKEKYVGHEPRIKRIRKTFHSGMCRIAE